MKLPIYMDNHATTPVDPRVFEEMAPYFTEKFGNAASRNHSFGWDAEEAVDKGRQQVADLISASPKEIIFTSGATESDNLAIKGVAEMYRERGNHIITVVTEHKAVLDTCKHLEKTGYEVTYLPVDKFGMIDLDDLKRSIKNETILISIMMANNEIGVIQPISEIGKIAKEKGVLFHTDATQAIGKVPFNVNELGVDLASISAHKMYGPKGIGALYVRRKGPRVQLAPQIDGGGHERGMRSGTLQVTGIVGLGKAAEIAGESMDEEGNRLMRLREKLHAGINSRIPEVYLNGHPEHRLPGNLNVSFAYVEGGALLMGLMGTAGMLSLYFVLPALGRIYDNAKFSLAGGKEAFDKMTAAQQEPILALAGQTSFRYVALVPVALLFIFGAIWFYDRSKGGYKAVKIDG